MQPNMHKHVRLVVVAAPLLSGYGVIVWCTGRVCFLWGWGVLARTQALEHVDAACTRGGGHAGLIYAVAPG
jgi:hypothetical protein